MANNTNNRNKEDVIENIQKVHQYKKLKKDVTGYNPEIEKLVESGEYERIEIPSRREYHYSPANTIMILLYIFVFIFIALLIFVAINFNKEYVKENAVGVYNVDREGYFQKDEEIEAIYNRKLPSYVYKGDYTYVGQSQRKVVLDNTKSLTNYIHITYGNSPHTLKEKVEIPKNKIYHQKPVYIDENVPAAPLNARNYSGLYIKVYNNLDQFITSHELDIENIENSTMTYALKHNPDSAYLIITPVGKTANDVLNIGFKVQPYL